MNIQLTQEQVEDLVTILNTGRPILRAEAERQPNAYGQMLRRYANKSLDLEHALMLQYSKQVAA